METHIAKRLPRLPVWDRIGFAEAKTGCHSLLPAEKCPRSHQTSRNPRPGLSQSHVLLLWDRRSPVARLVGDGKRGIHKHIQYWKCQWCDKRFSSRLQTPLYRLKTDEGHIVLVLMLLAEGCDISVLVRCSGQVQSTSKSPANQKSGYPQ